MGYKSFYYGFKSGNFKIINNIENIEEWIGNLRIRKIYKFGCNEKYNNRKEIKKGLTVYHSLLI